MRDSFKGTPATRQVSQQRCLLQGTLRLKCDASRKAVERPNLGQDLREPTKASDSPGSAETLNSPVTDALYRAACEDTNNPESRHKKPGGQACSPNP